MKKRAKRLQMLVILGNRYWFYSVKSQEAWGECPDDNHEGRVVIGIDDDWRNVLDALVHELFETVMVLRQKSFVPYGEMPSGSTSRRWFMFDHAEFTLICAHVGNALCALLPKYQAEWNKLNRRKKP